MADSVLLIDDDADLRRALGAYFDRIGYEVAGAGTGEAGFEAFDRLRPDVVILDLHLPDVGGLDVLEQLKSRGGSVILLTGQGDIETAVRRARITRAAPAGSRGSRRFPASRFPVPPGTSPSGTPLLTAPAAISIAVPSPP